MDENGNPIKLDEDNLSEKKGMMGVSALEAVVLRRLRDIQYGSLEIQVVNGKIVRVIRHSSEIPLGKEGVSLFE